MDGYNQRMARTIVDKIFFLAHIDADVFVDFGCANGEVLKAISKFVPNGKFIGYDISKPMLAKASENVNNDSRFEFTDNRDKIVSEIIPKAHDNGQKVCLVLSSVIHEIYSYCSEEEISDFWRFVNTSHFDYIAIRDMIFEVPSSPKYFTINRFDYENIEKSPYYKELKDFENTWGKIYTPHAFDSNIQTIARNLQHFLLKYRYKDNWTRELKENYLPWDTSTLEIKMSSHYYEKMYSHLYLLPYLKEIIYKDFKFIPKMNTHIQAIYKARK